MHNSYYQNLANKLFEFDKLLADSKTLLIILHNNPDPDAIASGFALSYLTQKRYDLKASLAYGGYIIRAENKALVNTLKISLKHISRIKFSIYDRIAIVDSQPGAGNNSLPPDVHCHIVIDHHPQRKDIDSELILVDPEIGATSTLVMKLIEISGLPLSSELATALSYAISSETQDLGRETSVHDIEAYLKVFPLANIRYLSRIIHPKLPRSYFITLVSTLQRAMIFKNILCAHLGLVDSPEIIAQMADMLLQHHGTSWVLCTGRFKGNLLLSMRSSNPNAKAGVLIKKLVSDKNEAGGHDMFAGGKITVSDSGKQDYEALEQDLTNRFAKLMGYTQTIEWKPMLAQ